MCDVKIIKTRIVHLVILIADVRELGEVELILNYLAEPGLRLVKVEGEYAFATFGPTSQAFRIGSYEFTNA